MPNPPRRRWLGIRGATSALLATALTGLMLLTSPAPAMAGQPPALVATSTTTVSALANTTTPLDGVGLSGQDDDTSVQVTVSTDHGTLAIASTSGLTLGYGNNWSGDPSISFTGTLVDANTGLSSLTLSTGNQAGQTASVTLTALETAPGYIYSPTSQHFYKYVADEGISADAARTAALAQTFDGQSGYLATIPDQAVNELLSNRIEGADNVWMGARSIDTFDESPARTWVWGDGPRADSPISFCSNVEQVCDFIDNAGLYNSWGTGEPNNSSLDYDSDDQPIPYSGEWVGVLNWSGAIGAWNDLPSDAGDQISGYLVEYGDQEVGASSFPGVVTANSQVAIVAAPGAPTAVSAIAGNGTASVSFAAPDDSGSPITGYTVTTSPGGITTACPGSPCDVTDLDNGTEYTFTVHATNAIGDSAESDPSNAVVPATVPQPATDVSVDGGDKSATVSFDAPSDDGGAPITSYTVTAEPGHVTTICPGSPCVVTGLTNGTRYAFTVHATNAAGDSTETDAYYATPVSAPGAPTDVEATAGDTSATVTFTAPEDDGGNPITRYTVVSAPGGIDKKCPGSPCTVTGLTNGTKYTFTVVALNEIGTSADSNPSNAVTPMTVPGVPGDLTVVRGDSSADLSFLAPNSDGGASITRYEVSLDGGDHWQTLTTSGSAPITATVEGLSNGTSYDIQVRAVNQVGAGEAAVADPVKPAGKPGTPTGVTAIRGDGKATVSFDAPADHGAPITGYTVTAHPGGATATCTVSPCVVDELTNGTGYTFTVVATNDVGDSAASADSASVTPAAAPGAPTLQPVVSTDAALLLSFTAPQSTGGSAISGYQVSLDGGPWLPLTTSGSAPSTATVTGLTNGTSYAVKVRAVNAVGGGTASGTQHGTPATVPGKPRSVSVAVTDGDVTVHWSAPSSDGGSPVTKYTVTASPGGQICQSTTTSCTFTGLPVGLTYTFSVVAANTAAGMTGTGTGAPESSAPVRITTVPGAPRTLAVTPGDRVLALTFTAPADDGGSAVTSYQVSLDGGDTWKTVKTKGTAPIRVAVAPVLNGKSFSVQVRARNLNGTGPGSASVGVSTIAWFSDPVSPKDRAAEVTVPKKPGAYHGALKHTTATYRSANGTIAYPGTKLKGRQLQAGQAVNLTNLFTFDGAKLSKKGRSQIKAVAGSLHYVSTITCEGYADFGGSTKREKTLSAARAKIVCSTLKSYAKQLTSRAVKSYAGSRPVVVGGKASQRGANRRVVVLVRG